MNRTVPCGVCFVEDEKTHCGSQIVWFGALGAKGMIMRGGKLPTNATGKRCEANDCQNRRNGETYSIGSHRVTEW